MRRAKIKFVPKITPKTRFEKNDKNDTNRGDDVSETTIPNVSLISEETSESVETISEEKLNLSQAKPPECEKPSTPKAQSSPEPRIQNISPLKPKDQAQLQPKPQPQSKIQPQAQNQSHEVKIKKKIKISKGIIDKNKVTMYDLLYFNPPLSKEKKNLKKVRDEANKTELEYSLSQTESTDIEEDEEEVSGPRVKVGPDGQIILDEESLVIKKRTKFTEPVIEETHDSKVTYASFKRGVISKNSRWTKEETLEFYAALNMIGADFSMMADLIFKDRRTRTDLKNKFHRELKLNRPMIEKALYENDYEYCLAEEDSDGAVKTHKSKA